VKPDEDGVPLKTVPSPYVYELESWPTAAWSCRVGGGCGGRLEEDAGAAWGGQKARERGREEGEGEGEREGGREGESERERERVGRGVQEVRKREGAVRGPARRQPHWRVNAVACQETCVVKILILILILILIRVLLLSLRLLVNTRTGFTA